MDINGDINGLTSAGAYLSQQKTTSLTAQRTAAAESTTTGGQSVETQETSYGQQVAANALDTTTGIQQPNISTGSGQDITSGVGTPLANPSIVNESASQNTGLEVENVAQEAGSTLSGQESGITSGLATEEETAILDFFA